MGWSVSLSKAYYDGETPSISLFQTGIMTIGEGYSLELEVVVNGGKITVYGFQNTYEYTTSGTYYINDIASSTTFTVTPSLYLGVMYTGHIDLLSMLQIAVLNLVDTNDVVLQSVPFTATRYGFYITQQIDWGGIDNGLYKLKYTSGGFDYYSDCIRLTDNIDCTKLIQYSCDDNAFGFEFEQTGFNPVIRLDCKVWQPSYSNDRNEYFADSRGVEKVIYVNSIKKYLFTINEQPEYIHDALRLAVKCDTFEIDGKGYSYSDSDYSPKWRKSSTLAPVEIEIRENKAVINANCV